MFGVARARRVNGKCGAPTIDKRATVAPPLKHRLNNAVSKLEAVHSCCLPQSGPGIDLSRRHH